MLVYTLPSILSFTEIEDKISVTLQRLADESMRRLISVLLQAIILFYKGAISPLFTPRCRYTPKLFRIWTSSN